MEPENTSSRWVKCVLVLINNVCTVLVLQFYQAVCLRRCQTIQYAGEHPGTSQALWLWCQHAGTLICLCQHDSERERKMEERGGTIVWSCITTALCACGQPVNHPFPFQVKTLAPSQGSSTHINCPPHHCSAASKKISYYNYGLHTQEQSLIDMYSVDMGRAGVADNYCGVFVQASEHA